MVRPPDPFLLVVERWHSQPLPCHFRVHLGVLWHLWPQASLLVTVGHGTDIVPSFTMSRPLPRSCISDPLVIVNSR